MNFRTSLIQRYSKEHTNQMVNYIGADQSKFDELMELFLGEDALLAQRAAWVMGHSGIKHPKLIDKHFQAMIDNLKKPNLHDGIKRNTLRVWQFVDLPEDFIGEVADICFNYLMSHKEAIAIKVFSMTVLFNISQKIPELQNELRLLIEDQMPHGSAGFRSRGKKILKKLNQV